MFSAAYLLSDTARLLRRAFDERVRQLDLTSTQARLLLILSRDEGQNQAFYAERLEVEPISLCRLLDRMVATGRIERRPDPADRRAWRVFLTADGHKIIKQVNTSSIGLEAELLLNLSDEQKVALVTALETIRDNLSHPKREVAASDV
jgi:DNA-binding MarR family transcriptional regulator